MSSDKSKNYSSIVKNDLFGVLEVDQGVKNIKYYFKLYWSEI